MDITHPQALDTILNKIASGGHAIFNGCGVYAFITADPEVGMQQIARAKGRNLLDRPPVMASAWDELEQVIDWDYLGNDLSTSREELISFFKLLHHTLPIVTIFPIVHDRARDLIASSVAPSKRDTISRFIESLIWKDDRGIHTCAFDTLAFSSVRSIVETAKLFDKRVVFITSANKPGDPTIDSPSKVHDTFNESLIVEDLVVDLVVERHKKKIGKTSCDNSPLWTSYTSIQIRRSNVSVNLHIIREGSVHIQAIREFIASHSPKEFSVTLSSAPDARQLTTNPVFKNYAVIQSFLSHVKTHHDEARKGIRHPTPTEAHLEQLVRIVHPD